MNPTPTSDNYAKIIAETFKWKNTNPNDADKCFVALVNGKLVLATNSFDVLGISLDYDNDTNKSLVGLCGIIKVRDNGACSPGKKCDVANGLAVPGTKWFVIERTSANVVKILYK